MDSRFSATSAEKVDRIIIIMIMMMMIVVGKFFLEFFLEQTILGNFCGSARRIALWVLTCAYCKVVRNELYASA
jgi:hypothetical protein